MALTKCKECGGAVAEMAAKCPHCGTGYPAIAPGMKFSITMVVLFAATEMSGGEDPENRRGVPDRQRPRTPRPAEHPEHRHE